MKAIELKFDKLTYKLTYLDRHEKFVKNSYPFMSLL